MSDSYVPSAAMYRANAPGELEQLQQIAFNANVLAQVNPWMGQRGDILQELAASGLPPDELARNGAALFGLQNLSALRDTLTGLSDVAQRSVYSRLTETQQRALAQLSYEPPKEDHRGLFGDVVSAAGSVVAPVWSAASTVGVPIIGGALDALTWIGDQPAHLYRAIRQLDGWQQWVALGGALAGAALIPLAAPALLAGLGTLASVGVIGGTALAGATVAGAATNPVEWWEAMQRTYHGERSFSRSSQERARELLRGDEMITLAKSIADELDPYELATQFASVRDAGSDTKILEAIGNVAKTMADEGSAEFQRIYGGLVTLSEQEPFRQAVIELQLGKVSFGRDLANVVGLDPGTTTYNVLSGAVDGLWAFAVDPTLMLGVATRARRLQRYGIGMGDADAFLRRLAVMSDTAGSPVQRVHNQIVGAINAGDFTAMPRAARSLWQPLSEWKRGLPADVEFDRRQLLKFFGNTNGFVSLLQGKSMIRGLEMVALPRGTETAGWGAFVRSLREFRDAADDVVLIRQARKLAAQHGVEADFDAAMPLHRLRESVGLSLNPLGQLVERGSDLRDANRVARAAGEALGRSGVGTPLVSLLASITSMAPSGKAIRIVGHGVEDDIPKFIETMGRAFNMPSAMRDNWLNAVMTQGASNQRIVVLQSFLDTGLNLAGMHSTPELRDLAATYLSKFRQAYAHGGLDRTVVNGIEQISGVLPEAHQAALLVMPDLRELTRIVRRGHILKHIARVTDSDFVEASMNRIWKPAVLLRPGFIPRAAGEELLAWAMRVSEGSIAQEFGARSLAQFDAYADAALKRSERQLLDAVEQKALDWKLPAHVRPLARMFSRTGWADPVEHMLDRYAVLLRRALTEGIGGRKPTGGWYDGLLYGRQHSWRRMLVEGVDPVLKTAADTWVRRHAGAVMAATSSLNAGPLDPSIVNPDVQMFLTPDPKNPGEFVETPMVTISGVRDRVTSLDPRYASAVMHRLEEPFDDDIVGPVLERMQMRYFPGFDDLQPTDVVSAIKRSRLASSYWSRKVLVEFLQPREDNLRAAAEMIFDIDPTISSLIDTTITLGNGTFEDLRRYLGYVIADTDRPGPRLERLADELEQLQPLIDLIDGLAPDSRAWLAAAVSADLASDGRFFDVRELDAFAKGGARGRPRTIFYRGVQDPESWEVLPDGSLRLVGMHHDHWQGPAISMSTNLEQAALYAEDGGFMLELDGEWMLNHFGTTLDEVSRRPVDYQGDTINAARGVKGIYLVGSRGTEVAAHVDEVIVPPGHWHMPGDEPKGGFNAPRWSSFFTDRKTFMDAFVDDLQSELMRTENLPFVRQSKFAMQTADGRQVVSPPQEGVDRYYRVMPAVVNELYDEVMQPMYRIAAEIDNREPFIALAERIVDRNTTQSRFMTQVGRNERIRLLTDHLVSMHTDTKLLYSDTRIVRWLEEVLGGPARNQRHRLMFTDVPRMRSEDASIVSYGPLGHARRADPGLHPTHVIDTNADARPTSWVQRNNSHDFGTADERHLDDGVAPWTEAVRDWAKLISAHLEQTHRSGMRETMTAREGTPLFRRVRDQLLELEPGTPVDARLDLFDADGNAVRATDNRLLAYSTSTPDDADYLWPIIGPMLRDRMERRAGLGTQVRKARKKELGGFQNGAFVPEYDTAVTMTRSRVDDLHLTDAGQLPNVALAEVRVPTSEGLWYKTVQFGFNKVIGPAIDAIVRSPMSFHYYAHAYRQNSSFFEWMVDKDLFNNRIPQVFGFERAGRTLSQPDRANIITVLKTLDLATDQLTDAQLASSLLAAGRMMNSRGRKLGFDEQMAKLANRARVARRQDAYLAAQSLSLVPVDTFRRTAHRLASDDGRSILAYYEELVPSDVWDEGLTAVNAALDELDLPAIDRAQFEALRAGRHNLNWVQEAIEEASTLRAISNVVPFIDSHEIRSQFATIGGNLLPFWYAEEQFLRRWARTMSIDGTIGLATMRKAQLGYMGLRSAGIIRTDENGNDWFVYPGSGLLIESMAKLPIVPDTLPVGVLFQAQVEQLLPGLNTRFGTPAVSPWVSVPMGAVTTIFPDTVPIKRAVLGDFGAQQAAVDQIVPATVRRAWEAAFGDEDSSRKYAAAMMAAAAMMEAEGNGLPDAATPDQLEEYQDRLRNHARVVLWAQALVGFVAPGAPVALNSGEDTGSFDWLTGMGVTSPDEVVSARYREYIGNLGINEGTSRFLADFPDSDLEDFVNPLAFTTPMSTSVSGAPLPATRTALAWYNDHREWVDQLPEAGAWFLPPDSDGDSFDYYSYAQQLTSGLRKQQTVGDFMRSIKYRQAAAPYFDTRRQYEELAAEADANVKRRLDAAWDTWRTNWLATHPIFAEELVSGEARQRRARTIDQLRYAVSDPGAPSSPATDGIREMSSTFDQYKLLLAQLSARRDARSQEQGRRVRAAFAEWAAAWTLRHPELEQMWNAVYRPEADL